MKLSSNHSPTLHNKKGHANCAPLSAYLLMVSLVMFVKLASAAGNFFVVAQIACGTAIFTFWVVTNLRNLMLV
jgi:hypothetical protein